MRILLIAVCLTGFVGPLYAAQSTELTRLIGQLSVGSSQKRVEAIKRLRDFGPRAKAAVPALIKTLKARGSTIKKEAALALAAIGPAALPALLEAVKQRYPMSGLRTAFAAMGKAGLPGLLAMIHGPYAGDRYVLQAIGELGDEAKEAIPELLSAYRQNEWTYDLDYARALGGIGPVALPELLPLLQGTDGYLRELALRSIALMGPKAEGAVPALIEYLEAHGRRLDAKDCCRALGKIGAGKEAVPALARALKRDTTYADEALKAVGEPAIGALLQAIGSPDILVRKKAAAVLTGFRDGKAPRRIAAELLAALESDDANRRHGAALALGQMGELAAAAPALRKAARDPSPLVAAAAAIALKKLNPKGRLPKENQDVAIENIIRAMKQNGAGVRLEMLQVLKEMPTEQLGSYARELVPFVVEAMKIKRSPIQIPAAALLFRIARGDAAADSTLKRMASDHYGSALGYFRPFRKIIAQGNGNAAAVAPLIAALDERDAYVRTTVLVALGLTGEHGAVGGPKVLASVKQAAAMKRDDRKRKKLESAVVWAFAGFGAKGLPALVAGLEDAASPVRAKSAALMVAYHADNEQAQAPLVQALSHKDPAVREATIGGLRNIRRQSLQRFIPHLFAALRDREAKVRKQAAYAVARGSKPALMTVLKNDDLRVRTMAVEALGLMVIRGAEKVIVPALTEVLRDDPDTRVRRLSISALKQQKAAGPAVILALAAAARDADKRLRSAASYALERLSKEGNKKARMAFDEIRVLDFGSRYLRAQQRYYEENDPDLGRKRAAFAQSLGTNRSMKSYLGDDIGTAEGDPGPRGKKHGYRYKILKAQGPHAKDGAMSYLEAGRMTRGHALLAYPLIYGFTGRVTFLVSHHGAFYERDLGRNAWKVIPSINIFDPDPSWTRLSVGGTDWARSGIEPEKARLEDAPKKDELF